MEVKCISKMIRLHQSSVRDRKHSTEDWTQGPSLMLLNQTLQQGPLMLITKPNIHRGL